MDKLVSGLKEICAKTDKQVYVPYGIGCGLAGGNWNKFMELINKEKLNIMAVKLK